MQPRIRNFQLQGIGTGHRIARRRFQGALFLEDAPNLPSRIISDHLVRRIWRPNVGTLDAHFEQQKRWNE